MHALWRCALLPQVQCADFSRGVGRPACIHVAMRHTGSGQQGWSTSDYTGSSCVERGAGYDPVSSPSTRGTRVPGYSGTDFAVWSPPSLGPLHDRPSATRGGFGAQSKSVVFSVASVAVLVAGTGHGAGFRLDHHRGPGRGGSARLCPGRYLPGKTCLGRASS
jgi:hypothetical protein